MNTDEAKPTQEQLATLAAQIFAGGQHSVKWAVRFAFGVWEEAGEQLKEKEKTPTCE